MFEQDEPNLPSESFAASQPGSFVTTGSISARNSAIGGGSAMTEARVTTTFFFLSSFFFFGTAPLVAGTTAPAPVVITAPEPDVSSYQRKKRTYSKNNGEDKKGPPTPKLTSASSESTGARDFFTFLPPRLLTFDVDGNTKCPEAWDNSLE